MSFVLWIGLALAETPPADTGLGAALPTITCQTSSFVFESNVRDGSHDVSPHQHLLVRIGHDRATTPHLVVKQGDHDVIGHVQRATQHTHEGVQELLRFSPEHPLLPLADYRIEVWDDVDLLGDIHFQTGTGILHADTPTPHLWVEDGTYWEPACNGYRPTVEATVHLTAPPAHAPGSAIHVFAVDPLTDRRGAPIATIFPTEGPLAAVNVTYTWDISHAVDPEPQKVCYRVAAEGPSGSLVEGDLHCIVPAGLHYPDHDFRCGIGWCASLGTSGAATMLGLLPLFAMRRRQ
ncbi:MAG: hypothetical protein ACON5B_12140 [Myxococcota bacterium]